MKPFLFRIVALALLLTFMLSVISCNKNDAEGKPTDEVLTDDVFEENRSYMTLDASVKIYNPRKWNKTIDSYAHKISEEIKQKSGFELEVVYESDGSAPEICIGYAIGHAASEAAYAKILRGQYAVCVEDKNTTIAAYTNENLEEAVNAFVDHCIVKDGESWKLASISPKGDGKNRSTSVSAYRIVYAADAEEYIVDDVVPALQTLIKDLTKAELDAVKDSEPATEREIVVGNTNRSSDVIKKCYEGNTAYDDYRSAIIPDESRIFLVGSSREALRICVSNMEDYITYDAQGPKMIDLSVKHYVSQKMDTPAPRALADGADVRIMSYNVLNPAWGKAEHGDLNKVKSRIDKFVALALYYRPTVIGLQEAAYDWHKYFDKQLVSTGIYSFCCDHTSSGKTNMTGFLYDPSAVKVVDSYVIDLVEKSDHRVISVGVFEMLNDGKRFVVMNTHPVPNSYEEYPAQMAQIAELEKAEAEKYPDLPIFLTGDFNTNNTMKEYAAFVEALSVTNARDSAESILNHNVTYAGFKMPAVCSGGRCIDHIFHNDKAKVKLFNTVIEDGMHFGSDHMPIYADVALLRS